MVLHSKRSRIRKNLHDHKVVSGSFDPYSLNIIAPDHLFSGHTEVILTCFSFKLRSIEEKQKLETFLYNALGCLGMKHESSLFKYGTKSLVIVSMSTLYAPLTILPTILSCFEFEGKIRCFSSAQILCRLSSLTFWWPSRDIDGIECTSFVHNDSDCIYHRKLRSLSVLYI